MRATLSLRHPTASVERRASRPAAVRTLNAKRSLIASLCAALLAGCAGFDMTIPEHKRPETPAKPAFSQQPAVSVSAAETISPEWWKAFNDPYLDSLIARAIAGNFDLKSLAARIGFAKAQITEARAGALPIFDIAAGTNIEKVSSQRTSRTYSLGTQVNWDLDIWGSVEKGVQAQQAEFRATEADWRAGYLRLVSDVSTTYFQVLQFDEQIARQRNALAKNQQILTMFVAMRQNGVIPETQVVRQRAEISRMNKDLLELQRSRDLAENALSTLVGVPAKELRVPTGRLQDTVQLPSVPVGLPAQLLARRPDLVAAEYRVLATYNLIGQAKLAQLPSISLTGRAGSASFALNELLRTFTLGLAPSINLPVLNPGVRARVTTTEAQAQVVEQEYRRTVMAAFEEVENTLVNLDSRRKQKDELERQLDQLKMVSAQVAAQLKEGLVSQLELFETERSLLTAELAVLNQHQLLLADTVTLYKALGGGWPPVAVANEKE